MNKLLIGLIAACSLYGQTVYINTNQTIEGTTNFCGSDTGSGNLYVCANPAGATIASYRIGHRYSFRATHTNTAASTYSVDGLGAVTIKKQQGAADLVSGDICSGSPIDMMYDGTNMQIQSTLCNVAGSGGGTGTLTGFTINGSGTGVTITSGVVNVALPSLSNGQGTCVSTTGTVEVVNECSTYRTVSGVTDAITASDCGGTVIYQSASAVNAGLAQGGVTIPAKCTITAINQAAGVVTITPTTSQIASAATFVLPAATKLAPSAVDFFVDNTSCGGSCLNYTVLRYAH